MKINPLRLTKILHRGLRIPMMYIRGLLWPWPCLGIGWEQRVLGGVTESVAHHVTSSCVRILRRSFRGTDRSQERLTNLFDAVGKAPAQEIDPKEIMRRSVTWNWHGNRHVCALSILKTFGHYEGYGKTRAVVLLLHCLQPLVLVRSCLCLALCFQLMI